MIKKLLVGALVFASTLACGITTVKKIQSEIAKIDMYSALSSDDMIEYKIDDYGYDEVLSYFEGVYGQENVLNLEFVSDTFYNVPNFNQMTLNDDYNDEYDLGKDGNKAKIDNTCALVACAEIVDYYSNILGEFNSETDRLELYMKVVNACLKAGCTSRFDGTYKSDIEDCVSVSFKRFNSKRRGDSNWFYLLDNIHDAVKWRSALQLSLSDHSVVVCGLLKYKLTYLKKHPIGKYLKKVDTFEFVHICDGWGSDYGSIIPADRIGNITSGHQVTWAKK